jgi:hypothetical protein
VARIIDSEVNSQPISKSNSVWRILLIGVILGVLYCGLTVYLSRFIGLVSAAGDIATILVATVGIIIMLNFGMARPLLVAVASAVSLWGLSKLTDGLGWLEVLAWSILIYCLAYLVFSWLTRYKRVVPVLIISTIVVVIIRIIIIW